MIIWVEYLMKYFGYVIVFDFLDFEIEEGVIFIMGFNGGGKSMFLNFCVGIY